MLNNHGKLLSAMVISSLFLGSCSQAAEPVPPTSTELAATETQAPPTSTSTPKVAVFTSDRYGYTLTLPGTWQMLEIPGQWDGITKLLPGNPGTDVFRHTANDPVPPLEIGFMPVAEGTTLESWAEAEGPRALFPQCTLVAELTPTTVAGQPALMQKERCNTVEVQVLNVYLVYAGQGILIQGFNIGVYLTPVLEGFELPE